MTEPEPEPHPAPRSAADALIVAGVAGATWAWHLRRGRRAEVPSPAGP